MVKFVRLGCIKLEYKRAKKSRQTQNNRETAAKFLNGQKTFLRGFLPKQFPA